MLGAIFFDTEMDLAEAFDAAVEEVNALTTDLQLEPIKHYVTVDDSIVLQDLCEHCEHTLSDHCDILYFCQLVT